MDSINHIALRCMHPTMNGVHTDRHHVGLSSYVKALSKGTAYLADMAHPLLVWMPAVMRDSSNRAYKSLKTSLKLSLT
eukprot:506274-Pelagomonas_calceolata.AAC.1